MTQSDEYYLLRTENQGGDLTSDSAGCWEDSRLVSLCGRHKNNVSGNMSYITASIRRQDLVFQMELK